MDDEVCIGEEARVPHVLAGKRRLNSGDARRRVRLVVRRIDDGHAIRFQSITERQRRMMQVLRGDVDVTDLQRPLHEIMVVQRGAKFLEGDRKIRGLHLSGQRLAQRRADATRTIDVPLVTANEKRCKKGKALNVIPMRVADQDVAVQRRDPARDQRLAEPMGSSAAIE